MLQVSVEQAFLIAFQHFQAGRLQDAQRIYQQLLTLQPRHPGPPHMLGLIASLSGRNDLAEQLIRQAIALSPDFAEAHSNLGVILCSLNRKQEAAASLRQAVALKPDFPDAHNNLGNLLRKLNQFDDAIAAYRQVIQLQPDNAPAHFNLAEVFRAKGNLHDAVLHCQNAIAIDPRNHEAHNSLGNSLADLDQLDHAVDAYQHSISLKSDYAPAYCNLGNVLKAKGLVQEAIDAQRKAVALSQPSPSTTIQPGNALTLQTRPDASASYPANLPECRYNLATTLLKNGDFSEGWQEYDARIFCGPYRGSFPFNPLQQWTGQPLDDHTLLLYTEQGLGDTLQFIRYLPLVAQRAKKIIIQCQLPVHRLLQLMPQKCAVFPEGFRLPHFDFHCPLISLPRIFNTTLDNIPNQVPYLSPKNSDVELWRTRVAADPARLKVGIAWAGNPTHRDDRNRSLNPALLAPLAEIPSVQLYSLQKSPAAQFPPPPFPLIDLTLHLNDFADTAALVTNLDLVIAVDTAVVHLAGALAKPVWTLLPFAADWRWLLTRTDSPWYPTMRLFRQPAAGNWPPVIQQITQALSQP